MAGDPPRIPTPVPQQAQRPARPPSLPHTPMRPRRTPAATGFNSAPLVRWLAALQVADVAPAAQGFAERLSAWLDWTDAIALAAALHDAPPTAAVAPRPDMAASAQAVITACQSARHDLAQAISTDKRFATGLNGATLPRPAQPAPGATSASAAPAANRHAPGFAPWRRLHQAHQRAMAARIAPLRERLRAALAAHSPGLARLAALDAVLQAALTPREDHVLSSLPSWLEKALAQGLQSDSTDSETAAAGPETVGRPLQTALLAELDLRLQPLEGMVATLAEALATGLLAGPAATAASAARNATHSTAHRAASSAPRPT